MKAEEEEVVVEAAASARLDVWRDGGRWDEVRATWERGTEGLGALKGGLTESVARMERVGGVVEYLEGGR